jgi:ribosomal protein S18 acetylase RimI-like enzyme
MTPGAGGRVRPAGPGDARLLSVLGTAVWVDTYVPGGLPLPFADHLGAEYGPERYAAHLANPRQRLWIAETAGLAAGFLRLDLDAACPAEPSLTAEIATLYILRGAQGRGLGSALVAAAEKEAAARGETMWLTVNAENPRAIAFYARRGWREIGRHDFAVDGGRFLNLVLKGPDLAWAGDTR